MNWIQKLVDANRETESPERFYYWAALTTISAILAKRVWLDRHVYKLYPNIFVFLVAGSGMKKSIPVVLSRNLVELAGGVRVVSGRNSIQKILEDLSKAYSLEGGGMVKNAQGYIINSELASFLIKDPDALSILTDIYDTHSYPKEWKYNLKSSEAKLKEPCITWLGATNEEHFEDCIPQVQIRGGFVGRVLIVHSLIPGNINSLVNKPESVVNLDELTPFLKQLREVSGEIRWTIEGGKWYDQWYNDYSREEHYDNTGTSKRMGDHILKVAILIAMAHNYDLNLRVEYLQEAKAQCMECLGGTRKITVSNGRGGLTEMNKIVLRMLLKEPTHQILRKKLANRFWQEGYSTNELDLVIAILLESDAISVSESGKEVIYVLKKSVIDHYQSEVAS